MIVDDKSYFYSVTTTISKAVRENKAPFLRDLPAGEREIPHNPIDSGRGARLYNNLNGIYLDCVASINGWRDPRWLSAEDIINSNGRLKLRTLEKPTFVAVLNKFNEITSDDRGAKSRYVAMYNAEQIRGMPPYEYGRQTDYIKERRDSFTANTTLSHTSCQQLSSAYFEDLKQRGVNISPAFSAIAQYNLSLTLGTSYTAPVEKVSISNELLLSKSDHILNQLYNCNKFAVRICNKGFTFDRGVNQTGLGRVAERDHAKSDRVMLAAERKRDYERN